MKLVIDSTNNLKTVIEVDGKMFVREYQSPREQNVLQAALDALEARNISLEQLAEIEVKTGPGSFTGIRVGISVAQALGLSLNLKVNENSPLVAIEPKYGKPVSITRLKS